MKIAEILFENFGHDGDKHFNMDHPNVHETQNPRSRSALVHMTPADFLSLTPAEHSPEKLANTRRLASEGIPFRDVPSISFTHDGKGNARVYGHEGRHRSHALHELGIQSIPVIMRSVGSRDGAEIRWGSQNGYDKVPVMPRILHGQERSTHSIPFPQNQFLPVTETRERELPGPKVAGSGKDFRQNAGHNTSSGKMPGKVAGSGKAMKVKPGFVG